MWDVTQTGISSITTGGKRFEKGVKHVISDMEFVKKLRRMQDSAGTPYFKIEKHTETVDAELDPLNELGLDGDGAKTDDGIIEEDDTKIGASVAAAGGKKKVVIRKGK